MAWSVDNIYQFVKFLLNKNQAGGISSTDLFYAWNPEQVGYQSDLLGRFQARNNGKEGANTGLIENEIILTKLNPFTKPLAVTVTSGQATKPSDFIYTFALRKDGKKITQVDHDRYWAMLEDVIDPASETTGTYYYTEYLNYYLIAPSTVTSIDLDYISIPTDISWAWTLDGDGRQVYNAGLSVQPMWDQASIVEITKRTLKTLGVHFKDQDFAQFGQSVIAQGE